MDPTTLHTSFLPDIVDPTLTGDPSRWSSVREGEPP